MQQSPHFPESVREWLETPFGEALREQESRCVEEAFDGIFGEQCLQLGVWGEPNAFLRFARTQRSALIDASASAGSVAAVGNLHRLPVADDSIDCVLLPHTLDFSDRPHAILREVHRVLRSDGHLVILGFKTGGLWGLRRVIPGAGLPPHSQHLISDRRLRDWLKLLDIRIHRNERYFFRWPLPGNRGSSSPAWERRGKLWWPELAACYMLTAQKRVSTLTPMRPSWRLKTQVVSPLAETANRQTRRSRIRFDRSR